MTCLPLLAVRQTVLLSKAISKRIFYRFTCKQSYALTLSLLMSYIYIYIYIYGTPSKARNLTSYIYGQDFLLGILLLEPCISLIYA
jgi:hypothetical protein